MTSVLTIGYGRTLFDERNAERKRMEACARTVDVLHMIVFSKREHSCVPVHIGNLSIHPTHSRSRAGMFFDAYRIGSAILRTHDAKKSAWVISTQDPFEAGLVGYLLHLRWGVPLQVQEHGDFFGGPWWRKEQWLNQVRSIFGKWLLRRAQCVRTVSHRVARHLVAIGVDPLKIVTLPVASDVSAYGKNDPIDTAHDLHAQHPDAEAIVLAVGRLVREKNIASLIRAYEKVASCYPKTRLVIIGSGPEEAELKRLVKARNLLAQVSFIPWTDDVASYMRSADIFALTSYREGWGRVILEAMAAGLPGVVTDVGCVGEVFLDGCHGIVVPVDDAEALADALQRLITDPQKRRQFGEAAVRDSSALVTQQGSYVEAWLATVEQCVTDRDAL